MKFSKERQLLLVSAIGLVVATLFSGCQLVTIDYLFVATGGSTISGSSTTCPNGEIETFAVDSESGAIRSAAPQVCSGGTTPVALAISPGYQNLYVANQVDMNIVHFAVANNGVLANKDNVTLSAAPVAMAVSPDGNTLYVVSGTSSATLTVYSLSSGALGSVSNQVNLTLPGFSSDTIIPTGVTVLANGEAVYVTAYDRSSYNPGGTTTSSAPPGWVFGFATGSGGALTPTPASPYNAGVKPSGVTADPTNRFVYVTDFASNQLIGYGIYTGFQLNFLLNGPYKSGAEPSALAIDPRGKFIYVSDALDSTVTAYVIDLPSGTPSTAVNTTGSQTNVTDTQPLAVAIDPALGRFVYTANYLGNSVSGFQLDPIAGTLKQTHATPYPLHGNKPTALLLVPHGNHSLQTVTP
ncbi:MAG TPA: beta-propeller fold lactonase family protein [Terracidiphilus sp.]|jgi:6-phosphogluconolactonase (cycloisomerase 2 family)